MWRGGVTLKVLRLCIHSKIHRKKKATQVTCARPSEQWSNNSEELWIAHVKAVEMNVNEIFINYYFAIQHSHYRNHLKLLFRNPAFSLQKSPKITISQSSILITEITYKNTIGSTLKMNERTHLPLVNMDWANCRIKPHHRSTGGGRRTQRSVCPARLWTALRVQGVRCLHRHCLHVLDL